MIRHGLFMLLCVALVRGLTDEELAYFTTSGDPEQNTGIAGWVSITSEGDNWRIESNGLPDHDTGTFPARGTNPNEMLEQSYSYRIPKNPAIATESTCLPMGPIAVATNGVVMYSPWDADGENAVEGPGSEIFDHCDGHPSFTGAYHYHKQPSSCLFSVTPDVPSPIIGVALDGFAIYGPVDEHGNTLTSADLDECHGRVNSDGIYQYHTTSDFPYILGCYRGTPLDARTRGPNCHKAEDASADGSISGTTDTGVKCRNPDSIRCKNRQG